MRRVLQFPEIRLPLAVWVMLLVTSTAAIAQEAVTVRRSPELGVAWRETPRSPLIVAEVDPDAAGAKAGLMPGDVVISVNDQLVRSAEEMEAFLKKVAAGEKLEFQLRRQGETLSRTFVMPEARINMFGAYLEENAAGRIVVGEVAPGTPAERAGLRRDDILTSMAGRRADSLAGLADFMAKVVADDKANQSIEPIELLVTRRGEEEPLKLVIERESAPAPPRSPLPSRDLSLPAPANRPLVLGIEVSEQGPRVVVSRVMPRRPAAVAGLQPGDVIVSVGRNPIDSYTSLVAAVAPLRPGDEVPVEIVRGDRRGTLGVKVTEARANEEDIVLAQSSNLTPAAAPAAVPQDERPLREEVQMLRARVDALEQVVKELVQQLNAQRQRR